MRPPLSRIVTSWTSSPSGRCRDTSAKPRAGPKRTLLVQFTSPIILILVAATVLSMALGDLTDGAIILAIIVVSGGLGFWQERAAGRAVDALQARVRVRAELIRDGREVSIPVPEVVVGDLAVLRPGDVVPGDCRLIDAQRLQVDQSAHWWWRIPTDVFRAAWFIQFTVTEIIVLMVLRTNRPFLRSRPSVTLLGTGALLAAVTVALPYSPLAGPLGLAPPPGPVLATLAVLAIGYVAVNELTKRRVPPDRLGATVTTARQVP